MEHSEIESLLGAYALDAVDAEEAAAIEAHLPSCPRCRAELAAYREVAADLGNTGAEAPRDLWLRIAGSLDEPSPDAEAGEQSLLASVRKPARGFWRRPRLWGLTLVTAAAALLAITLLSLQVGHLDQQVHSHRATGGGELASAVASVLVGPHRTMRLVASNGPGDGVIVVSSNGNAYWVNSNLAKLSGRSTYQLWALSRGQIVSLGVLGADPRKYSAFRIQPGMTELSVTEEPEGGTPRPTTPVLVAAKVSTFA